MTNLFENCTRRYSIEVEFENCTETTNQCELIQDIVTAIDVFDWLSIYLSSGFFIISGCLNIYCFITAAYTYYYLEDETRKHYVFVLSRCLSSILAVFSMLTIQSILFSTNFTPSFIFFATAFSLYNFSMDSLLLSFIMVSLITYFGVVHPVFYRYRVTLRSLYITLGCMLIVSMLLAIPLGLYQAALNAPGILQCDVTYCRKTVQWITFSFACFTLLLTVVLNGFVVISLYLYHFKAVKNGIEVPEVISRARIRLTWTFFALIIICFIELFPVGMLIGFDKNNLKRCESFYQANALMIQSIVSSVETLFGSIVFMADPLINLFFDKNISKTMKLQMNWMRTKLTSSRNNDIK